MKCKILLKTLTDVNFKLMNILEIYKNNIMNPNTRIMKYMKIDSTIQKRIIQKIALQNEAKFEFTKKNKPFYELLFLSFTGNPKFEKLKMPGSDILGSLNKGNLIFGPVGCGKSFALETVFKTYTADYLNVNSFRIFQYSTIKLDYQKEGAIILDQFGNSISNSGGIKRNETKTILIDDFLKNGSTVAHFNNKIELAEELINLRYEAYKRSGKLTHFTTNLYPKELSEILDYRSISRLQEMCNFIVLEDVDWRVANNL